MEVHTTSEGYDLSDCITKLLDAIRSDDPIESLKRLVGLQPFVKLANARTEAEKNLREFPLSALFGRRTLSSDGRTIYRSPADEHSTIYGEKASVWERMIQDYQMRVNLLGSVVLPKAWHQISTDHLLQVDDFQMLAANSSIVPSLYEGVFARGLYYGYTGDFGVAVHLLAPSMEALVRNHLANVGERTSTISPEGNETEIGLSALMENERVVDLFGEGIVFELRALLCGPIGPNLRNNVAHGLIGDVVFYSGASVYLWWFTLKIVLMPFWNVLHNPEAAEAREPTVPKEHPESD